MRELLTVEQAFLLQSVGLTATPDFAVPKGGWEQGLHSVRVVKPNGEAFDASAMFHAWHFNIKDPTLLANKRWRVLISFADLTKDDLPRGSKIFASEAVVAALRGSA